MPSSEKNPTNLNRTNGPYTSMNCRLFSGLLGSICVFVCNSSFFLEEGNCASLLFTFKLSKLSFSHMFYTPICVLKIVRSKCHFLLSLPGFTRHMCYKKRWKMLTNFYFLVLGLILFNKDSINKD